jgi:hypothetical protein
MLESGRLDLDRMAKNRLDLDLIVTVHPRSGGQGGFGRVGAAACHRRRPCSRRLGARLAGARESGVPGLQLARGLA